MTSLKPDPRQVQLALEDEASWESGVVEDCTSKKVVLRFGDNSLAYGVSGRSAPFERGDVVELCADWSMIRKGQRYVVVFQDSRWMYGLSPALPSEAREWTPVARAGWLYGYQQWTMNEDWIDVQFKGLGDDREFEDWAFEAYTRMVELDDSDDD